ncbi:MAG: PEGA domain-containing protein [Clostridiales bacterium]
MGSKVKKYILRLLLFALPFFIYSCVDEQVVNDPVQNSNGSLYIESVPIGASIFFLGTSIGKVTPDSITNLASGNYEVALKMAGYKDSTFIVSILSNYRTTKSIVMRSVKGNGIVIVRSNPSGAQILLNGMNSGKITPDTLKDLNEGTFYLTLKLKDYNDTTFSTVINGNSAIVTEDITLKRNTPPQQQKASIRLSSSPQGASILLNNTPTGKVTPDSITNVYNGIYSITLRLSGYQDTTISVSIINNSSYQGNIVLKQIVEQKGSILVRSTPGNAQIWLNGSNTGNLTPSSITNLVNGSYAFTLKATGYYDTSFTVVLTNNQNITKDITLTRIPPKKNTISLQSDPSGAQIYLFGSYTGKNTPNDLTNLDDGKYDITLKSSGFKDTTFSVSVSNGVTKPFSVKMQDLLPDVEVTVDYQVTILKQLIFTYQFNQYVLLDNVAITNPNSETTTLNYNGLQIAQNEKRVILILIVQNGNWDLTFRGRKAGGSQKSFTVTQRVKVKD